MKKALLGCFLAVLVALLITSPVAAISLSYTAFIGANGTNCSTSGYISPSTDTRNQGDVLTVTFKNEQATPLQIRNFPGGTFTVAGNSQGARSAATMNSSFTYEAWLSDGSCKKASAVVTVNPAPAAPTPSSEPSKPSSPSPSTSQASQSSDQPTQPEQPATSTQAQPQNTQATATEGTKTAGDKSLLWVLFWILAGLLVLALAALVYLLLKKRKSAKQSK